MARLKQAEYASDATPFEWHSDGTYLITGGLRGLGLLFAEWLVEQELWKNRREDVVARLIKHREDGAKTYIASSMMEPFLEPFARRIGAEVIGTATEIVNGQLRLVGDMVVNEKKIEQVLSRLAVDRVDIAYGDSFMDIPMLEHADHPVAVYPDEKLKKLAQDRGWEILGDTGWYE